MLRLADNTYFIKGSILLVGVLSLFFFSACSSKTDEATVDRLNEVAYSFHYRNLDSTACYARRALSLSSRYSAGKAEAYNNLAFACIAKMNYKKADELLDSVGLSTDNQLELLIADIQYMRLCQRKSKNKNFYDYRERALKRLKRIDEETETLSPHLQKRLVYARSEFAIVSSTYYYYVGLARQSREALKAIDPTADIQRDTAQFLNYLYQIGSGGIVEGKSQRAIAQTEFEHLFKCYLLAKQKAYTYWEANSLQSISEHIMTSGQRAQLTADNAMAMKYLNEINIPDSLFAGFLAQKSLGLFANYGDIYQVAGAYRTLSLCYWEIGDYASSLMCLENSLRDNKTIEQAPDLVASIREQLSLVYSAMDDKYNSDINRNQYLDLQEQTRQDRQLEARAEQLENTSMQLNILIAIILVLIVLMIVLLFIFKYLRKNKDRSGYIEDLLKPLKEWEKSNNQRMTGLKERIEEVNEELYLSNLRIEKDKRISLDNRAKIFLVNNVLPYIDRIINEVRKIEATENDDSKRAERYAYMAEITDKINEYNDVLTHWIQLQQGQLRLHIESFGLKEVFDILSKSAMSFRLRGINFSVQPSDAVVKADKVLTLFMLNTLSDNARKFTQQGGSVTVSAEATNDYVEISVKDTGKGLSPDELSGIFDHKIYAGHGFGLMNCKGIMDKYRKISQIFSVCGLYAESEQGKGSRFYFRLPRGVVRALLSLITLVTLMLPRPAVAQKPVGGVAKADTAAYIYMAGAYADSAYYSNIHGTYSQTLLYADSVRKYLNLHYKAIQPEGKQLMLRDDNGASSPAELIWFREKLKTDYSIILDVRNETAVAALALHDWPLYRYNNKIYTQLFKARSADNGLAEYCVTMQHSRTNKAIAVVVLLLLLVTMVCAYYFFYYRNMLKFRFCVERIKGINNVLLSDVADEQKLNYIERDTSKYPDVLKTVIEQIKTSLERSVEYANTQSLSIELAEDEQRRAAYEDEQMYISNSVIDNCLSTLKHETMYYPSRIRQLVDEPERNIKAIEEVATYYKELYSILCEQVMRQVEAVTFGCKPVPLKRRFGVDECVLGDETLVKYLFDILEKQCGGTAANTNVTMKGDKYIVFDVCCDKLNIGEGRCQSLFTPSVENIPFLVCRQIVRENSELSGRHGCGITAEPMLDGGTLMRITLARYAHNEDK